MNLQSKDFKRTVNESNNLVASMIALDIVSLQICEY